MDHPGTPPPPPPYPSAACLLSPVTLTVPGADLSETEELKVHKTCLQEVLAEERVVDPAPEPDTTGAADAARGREALDNGPDPDVAEQPDPEVEGAPPLTQARPLLSWWGGGGGGWAGS